MSSPLYYNNLEYQTLYDLARKISILTGKLRMLNPNLYSTEGLKLVNEIHKITNDCIYWGMYD